jgi:hypothetical protein
MKIDPRQLQAVFLRPESAEKPGQSAHGSPADDFAAILEAQSSASQNQAAKELSLDESSASLLATSLLGRLQTEQASSLTVQAAESTLGVDQEVDSVIQMLESYMLALGDPSKTLKEIAPLADDLDRGATRLDLLASGLQEGDPLKGLTNDTAALAAVEAIKFRRGDFA